MFMKKIKLLSLMLVTCMFFTACQASDGKVGSETIQKNSNNDNTGNNSDDGNVDTSNMVWFPKSAKGTSEDGTLQAAIETEFDNSKLVYKYIMYSNTRERYYGFEIGYDNDKVLNYYDLTGSKDEDGEDNEKTEVVIEYIESEDALYVKEINTETGDLESYDKYVYKFDDEGRVIERSYTYCYYYYNEYNELVEDLSDNTYTYKFEYVDDGYNIIYNYNPWEMELANGELAECYKQEIFFIPYDKTKGTTETIIYYLSDGTVATLAQDGRHGVLCDNSQKTEYIYNNKGYLVEQYAYLADGTKKAIDFEWECEFNSDGNVQSFSIHEGNGNSEAKGVYTYDSNGNISKLELEFDGKKYTVEFEWMLIPKCLDDVNQMRYGNALYSISELIEDVVPEFGGIDLKDTYYTKEMLKNLLK